MRYTFKLIKPDGSVFSSIDSGSMSQAMHLLGLDLLEWNKDYPAKPLMIDYKPIK